MTWNSGVWLRLALRRAAPRPAARTAGPDGRRRRAPPRAPAPAARAKVGSPARSARSTSVLTKKPISPSISRARAAGDRACRRRGRPGRCSGASSASKAGEQRHEQRRALARGRAPASAAVSSGGERERQRARRGSVCTAGRGRSVGSSSSGGAPASCAPPVGELRRPAPRPRSQLALPGGEVGVLDRQLGRAATARPSAKARVERRQLARPGRPATSRRRRCGACVSSSTCSLGAEAQQRARAAAGPRARSNGRRGLVRGQPRRLGLALGRAAAPARSTIGSASAAARRDHLHRPPSALGEASCAAPRGGARSRRGAAPAPRRRARPRGARPPGML